MKITNFDTMIRPKLTTLIVSSLLFFNGISQNLVPNPDFENVISSFCGIMTNGDFESSISDWDVPTFGSPDAYFDNIDSTCYNFQPYSQYAGAIGLKGDQLPRSGHVMAGIVCYTISGFEQREYIQIQLSSPALVGASYIVECYVSLGDYCEFASDGIGMYLSASPIGSFSDEVLAFTPQITAGTIIGETTQWVRVVDTISPTVEFNYLTIGNFSADAATGLMVNPTASGEPGTYGSYFFVDDVRVERIANDPAGISEEIKGELTVYPNPFLEGITVELPEVGIAFDLVLLNSLGEVLSTKSQLTSNTYLELDALPCGVYTVILRNESRIYTQRIVK
jgi:hypothetical protein